MPSAVTANCASPGPPPLERAARRTPSHPSRLTCMLHKCAHASPSAGTSPLVGAGGHLVDEHDDARCARRAAWLRSCAICPTSWRRLAYVSSVFARTWNAIESTTTRRTHRPGRPGALFACPCAPATSRKRDVQASPPIAHGDGLSASDRMTKTINSGVCSSSSDLCSSSFYARRRFEWYHRGPLTPKGSQITRWPLVACGP